MRRLTSIVAAITVIMTLPLAAAAKSDNGAGGVSGPGFWVDGVQYRTVGTPTDLSHTGGPDHSFDTIYALADQENVATAGPGDQDFNGGRWRVRAVNFTDYAGALADPAVDMDDDDVLDSAAEVEAAVAEGYAAFGDIIRSFECPVIPVPRSQT